MEELIEKAKEYKIFISLSLVGLVLAGFFIINGKNQQETDVDSLSQEIVQESQANSSISESSEQGQTSQVQASSEEESDFLTVDVKGAVKNPGLYELKKNSRVNDAIQKAGGMTAEADDKSINLAQKLADEAVVYVAKAGEEANDITKTAGSSSTSPGLDNPSGKEKINLNTASLAELQTISGIGQKRAQDILDYREANGKFQSVDDLKNISGVGVKTIEKLRDYVTVD